MTCSWKEYEFPSETWFALGRDLSTQPMQKLCRFLESEYREWPVFPTCRADVFRAFREPAFLDVKVVILGQDPYHDRRAAGLAFSVRPGDPYPMSLKNIYSAVKDNLKRPSTTSGDLSGWASQGVLLLNTVLTVGALAGSHRGRGWEDFTDKAISLLNSERKDLFFLLWGKQAQKKAHLVNRSKHQVLCAVHPRVPDFRSSCDHFSRTNALIDW